MLFFISIFLTMNIMIIMFMTLKKSYKSFNNTFECGFNTKKKDFNKYSMNMFNYSILFLILDLEIIILTPMTKETKINISNFMIMIFIFFIFLLMMKEWEKMILQWTKWVSLLISNLFLENSIFKVWNLQFLFYS